MTFTELRREIADCAGPDFRVAADRLCETIMALSTADTIELISQIGAIPENVGHDSTEEKLYTKVSDILLAKSLTELNLEANVLAQRSDCADVVAQSRYHHYSLAGDAKSFRLSRTARNPKDYKVAAMDSWRRDCEYSVLVCPYFQYPRGASQIYKEALDFNVSLFSWEYLYVLLSRGIRESETVNLSQLWNQSRIISGTTTVERSKDNFLHTQNLNIARMAGLSESEFYEYFSRAKQILVQRGHEEIQYCEREIERVRQFDRDTAVAELLKLMKIDGKITTIKGFINQISDETD